MVGPTVPATGASTFGSLEAARSCGFTGHYHVVRAGVPLPEELLVVADGEDVGGPHARTHHTICPSGRMEFDVFVRSYLSLPWAHGGKL